MAQATGSKPGVIMDAGEIERALKRMAHEVVERNRDLQRILLIGIHSRGIQVAERLQRRLKEIANSSLPLGTLDVNPRRDDVERASERLETGGAVVPVSVDGRLVLLVDDVIFTGRTIRAAIDVVAELGRPSVIQVAALLDRGGREVPIKADFVGHNVKVSGSRRVQLRLQEVDGVDEAVLVG